MGTEGYSTENNSPVLVFHMGWVLSHHCENESCVHALVYQEKEPDWMKSEYCRSIT